MKKFLSLLLSFILVLQIIPYGAFTALSVKDEGSKSLSRRVAGEGMILLKNEKVSDGEAALPLDSANKVALFGIGQVEHAKGYYGAGYNYPGYVPGGGGSAYVNSGHNVDILEGLLNADAAGKIQLDSTLANLYDAASKDETVSTEPITQNDIIAAKERGNDTAVVVISRYSEEGIDRERYSNRGAYELLDYEQNMIDSILAQNFERVIVVLNIAGVMDTSWLADNQGIDAAVLTWLPGEEGGNALADIICGDVNPSGKLTDTFAKSYDDYISTQNYSDKIVTYYEDIFVGYRQFETFDPTYSRVNYEFGFGLSYTSFDFSDVKVDFSEDTATVTATVTNSGDIAGKEVVQVYFSAPQGLLGKAGKELAAFVKTDLIKPGKSQTVTTSFKISDMASYDDLGKTGFKSAYVLEAGEYRIYVGNSIKNAGQRGEAATYTVADTRVTEQLTQTLTPTTTFDILRADGTDETIVAGEDTSAAPEYTLPELEYEGEKILFAQVINGDATLEDFVAQLNNTQLLELTGGAYLDTLSNFGVPKVAMTDGPSGVRYGAPSTLFPCATLIACTWNPDLAYEIGVALGKECNLNGYDLLWAPSLNIHRAPLCGRNFEYYSEDPLLSGKFAAQIVKGVQSCRVAVTLKHFAANNQERLRTRNDCYVTERALREIYLEGFRIAVTESDPWGIMTSYNLINGTYASERYDLVTTIARGEWGFDGYFTSDWDGEVSILPMVLAGNEFRLESFSDHDADKVILAEALESGELTRAQLQRNAMKVLELCIKTTAADRVTGSVVTQISADSTTKISADAYSSVYDARMQASSDHYVSDQICNLKVGSFVEYNINVAEAGNYYLDIRGYDHAYQTVNLNVYVDGQLALTPGIAFKNYELKYKTYELGELSLTEGEHTLRIEYVNDGRLEFTYLTLAPSATEPQTVELIAKNEIEAESTLSSGAGNLESVGDRTVLSNLQQPTELLYYVNIATEGYYDFTAVLGSDDGSHLTENEGAFTAYLDDIELGSIVNYQKLDYGMFVDSEAFSAYLLSGKHTLRLVFSNGGMKLDKLKIQKTFSGSNVTADGKVNTIYAPEYAYADSGINTQNTSVTNGTNYYEGQKQIYAVGHNRKVLYEIDVAKSGMYDLQTVLQCGVKGAKLYVYIDDSQVPAVTYDQSAETKMLTYWSNEYYKTTVQSLYLSQGVHTITVVSDCTSNAFNIVQYELTNRYIVPEVWVEGTDSDAQSVGAYKVLTVDDGEMVSYKPSATGEVVDGAYRLGAVSEGTYVIKTDANEELGRVSVTGAFEGTAAYNFTLSVPNGIGAELALPMKWAYINATPLAELTDVGVTNVRIIDGRLYARFASGDYEVVCTAEGSEAEIEAAQQVIELIEGLPDVWSLDVSDKEQILSAVGAYEALSDSCKLLVTNSDTLHYIYGELTQMESDLNSGEGDDAAAGSFLNRRLTELDLTVLTVDDEAYIADLTARYNALGDEGKAKVTNYGLLDTANKMMPLFHRQTKVNMIVNSLTGPAGEYITLPQGTRVYVGDSITVPWQNQYTTPKGNVGALLNLSLTTGYNKWWQMGNSMQLTASGETPIYCLEIRSSGGVNTGEVFRLANIVVYEQYNAVDILEALDINSAIAELGDVTAADYDAVNALCDRCQMLDDVLLTEGVTNYALLLEKLDEVRRKVAAEFDEKVELLPQMRLLTAEDITAVQDALSYYNWLDEVAKTYCTNYSVLETYLQITEYILQPKTVTFEQLSATDPVDSYLKLPDSVVLYVGDGIQVDRNLHYTTPKGIYGRLINLSTEAKFGSQWLTAEVKTLESAGTFDLYTLSIWDPKDLKGIDECFKLCSFEVREVYTAADIVDAIELQEQIEQLPDISDLTDDDAQTVIAMYDSYKATREELLPLVLDGAKLEEAVSLYADNLAESVVAQIEDLPLPEQITESDAEVLYEARLAYDNLPDQSKVLVTNYKKLQDGETVLNNLYKVKTVGLKVNSLTGPANEYLALPEGVTVYVGDSIKVPAYSSFVSPDGNYTGTIINLNTNTGWSGYWQFDKPKQLTQSGECTVYCLEMAAGRAVYKLITFNVQTPHTATDIVAAIALRDEIAILDTAVATRDELKAFETRYNGLHDGVKAIVDNYSVVTDALASIAYSIGDINMDNSVDSEDVALLRQFMVGAAQLSDEQIMIANVNKSADGVISSADLVALLNMVRSRA